jgi:hypothetical protein
MILGKIPTVTNINFRKIYDWLKPTNKKLLKNLPKET